MRLPLWHRRQDDDLSEELRTHIAMAVRERVERGESPADAEAAVRRQFGNELRTLEDTRSTWGWTRLEQLAQDVRFGVRMLRKSPAFTVVALLTLALGIGANTALFSVVNAVLLNPLPFPHPEQLVTLHMAKPNFPTGAISFPNFRDWQAQNHTFSAMALSRSTSVNLIGSGEPEHLRAQFLTSDYFPLLGVQPVIGRNFRTGEDDPGGAPIVQISEGLWKRKLGGSSDVLGKSVNLGGSAYAIVGVIPSSFDLLLINFVPADIYLPLGQWGNPMLRDRGSPLGLHGIGRIRDRVTLAQARADMDAVSRHLSLAYPEANRNMSTAMVPLDNSMTGSIRPILLLLLGAVGFVLLIVCVNIASLLLVRSQSRMREFAVRAALGAGRARLICQLLSESLVLALAGGGLGVLLAAWGTRLAVQALPQALPRAQEIRLDSHVLLFSSLLSLAAAIAFGLIPALKTARLDLQQALQSGGRSGTGGHQRTQRAFAIMEIATALVLIAGAGLMIRCMAKLWRVDPGFDPHNVLAFSVNLSPSTVNASAAARRQIWREVHRAFAETPGVEAVSLRNGALPLRSDDELLFWMPGQPRPKSASEMNWSIRYRVEPDYLRAMRIPLLRGRFLTAQDTQQSPPVAVVDDVFAAQFFPHQNALGQHILYGVYGGDKPEEAEIVGIVGHVKQWGLDTDDQNTLRAEVYQAYAQQPDSMVDNGDDVTLRASGSPLALVPALKASLSRLNAENVLFGPLTLDQIVASSLEARRVSMIMLAAFAALALVLAAVGIYGVVAYMVGQRTREFGIRLALGASRPDLARMILGQGGRMALVGIAIGVVAGLALTRLMSGLLYGVSPSDPLTFGAVAVLLALVALAACYLPARRATRVDPMVALRYE